MSKYKIKKTSVETRLAIERRSAAMLPDRPTQAGFKPWDIRNALFSAIIADKGACLMGEIDRIVDETNAALDALEEKVTTAGIVTVSATQWTDSDPHTAMIGVTNLRKGSVALIMPADELTRIAATTARLTAKTYAAGSNESIGVAYLVRAEAATAPTMDLHMLVLVIQSGSNEDARVALIGVDAYGEGGGTGGVDETAVRELIRRIVPSWALNSTPPADAVQSVNGKTGAVTINIPSAPKDIGLGNVDNVKQYSASNPPPYPVTTVNGKKGDVSLSAEDVGARTASWTPTADDVGADPAGTAQTLVNDLASKTARDLANYYNKSQTLTKDEINTLVSAIPKFRIEVVSALPTSNISETTVYLVKSGADSSNLYTEYIRANGAWERLGTQTVDLTGYATEKWVSELIGDYVKITDIVNDLITNDAAKPLSAAQGVVIKALIDTLDGLVKGLESSKMTSAQVQNLITEALRSYLLQTELDAAINQALQAAKDSGVFDGASVTVVSVTESTESGGENVVTFSNGKSVKVKNGRVYMAADDYTMTAQIFAEMLGLSHVDLDNIVWVGRHNDPGNRELDRRLCFLSER